MTDQEKTMQVGRLAQEYSTLKGELNFLDYRLLLAQKAYTFAAQVLPDLIVLEGRLVVTSSEEDLPQLLTESELVVLLNERARVSSELNSVGNRVRAVAPHLLPYNTD